MDASSAFLYKLESPMTLAAFLISLHVSSNLTIHLTIEPSNTSVKSVICLNDFYEKRKKKNKFFYFDFWKKKF